MRLFSRSSQRKRVAFQHRRNMFPRGSNIITIRQSEHHTISRKDTLTPKRYYFKNREDLKRKSFLKRQSYIYLSSMQLEDFTRKNDAKDNMS